MKTITRILCAVAAILSLGACQQNDEEYLVRETDQIRFETPYKNSRKITLRCVGAWKTIVPKGAEWISTTPSEGVGNGQMDFINVNVELNEGLERTATIYLENGGKQYPISVYQVAGDEIEELSLQTSSVKFSTPNVASKQISFTCYSEWKAIVPEDAAWISVTPLEGESDGTPQYITINVEENTGEERTAVIYLENLGKSYEITVTQVAAGQEEEEAVLEGLPVSWAFVDAKGTTADKEALAAAKPEWKGSNHYVRSDDQGGAARITVVEADGKSVTKVNSWGYNDGHIYIKGLYLNDYWLLTIPVKNLKEDETVKVEGSINGSGSSAAFFLLEYSTDGKTWTVCDYPMTTTANDESVSYHAQSVDKVDDPTSGDFSATFTTPSALSDGNLYIRARVNADVRVTLDNTITTGGGGSTRLRGTWKVSVVE